MTNKENILKLFNINQLADILIRPIEHHLYDYECDDGKICCGAITCYQTSDNKEFVDYQKALKHEIEWLNKEAESQGG